MRPCLKSGIWRNLNYVVFTNILLYHQIAVMESEMASTKQILGVYEGGLRSGVFLTCLKIIQELSNYQIYDRLSQEEIQVFKRDLHL